MKIKRVDTNFQSIWLGMEDYKLTLIQSGTEILLKYAGEAPHGDSYFYMNINTDAFKGYIWGSMFLFPFNQNYILCSWMEKIYDRRTIIIDIQSKKFSILDKYWYDFKVERGEIILGNNQFCETMKLDISKISAWIKY